MILGQRDLPWWMTAGLLTKEGLVSFSTPGNSSPGAFSPILTSFQQHPGLPFADGLSAEAIQAAFDAEGVDFAQEEDEIYTPQVVVWAWLSQIIHKGEHRACRAAVARVVVLLIALGRKPCSDNTSTYCKARAKLPESVIQRMVYDLAASCERQLLTEWLCFGRRFKLVDGGVLSMPDTPDNQREYPQSTSQQEGLGAPSLRTVVLLSLATGMLTAMALGPCSGKETSELALFRQVLDRLDRGDVVLADRFFCSYFMVCLLQRLGVDFVSRLHQGRTADFRRGRRLGPGDHIVEWPRPERPEWMDQATYDQMPLSLAIREMEYKVNKKGFRADVLVIVTTLLDARKYDRDDLAAIYRKRWNVELDIRAIKCTLGIDVLSCKSPEMVRKEVWIAMLAYNLIRQKILQSALANGKLPREISFTAAVQKIAASWTSTLLLDDTKMRVLIETTLKHLSGQCVGHRPDRVEPRAVKRRPKALAYLMKPRGEARAEILAARAA
jgi:putative transposase